MIFLYFPLSVTELSRYYLVSYQSDILSLTLYFVLGSFKQVVYIVLPGLNSITGFPVKAVPLLRLPCCIYGHML